MTNDRQNARDAALEETVTESITQWIDRLKDGQNEAAEQWWDRYFHRLVQLASRRLASAPPRDADEEDVAISVFDSLCGGAAAGRFDHPQGRDDLWKLLTAITATKTVDQIRQRSAMSRNENQVRGDSVSVNQAGDDATEQEPVTNLAMTPDFLVIMNQQCRQLFGALPDSSQQEVARLKLDGFTNQQIAAQMGITIRSVERKLNLIREIWTDDERA